MGKSFKKNRDDWDDYERAEKFRKRRNDKLKKKHDHEEALKVSNTEINEEESESI